MDRILKLGASAQTEEVKAETERLTDRVKETFSQHISTNINLPPQDQALTRSCPNADCDGTVQGPDKTTIGNLRRTDIIRNPADPKVLQCTTCKTWHGCKEVLLSAISRSFERLGLTALPETSGLVNKLLTSIKYKMQRDPDAFQYGSEEYQAYMALIQLHVNSHHPNHTFSCKKKGGCLCRFRLPYQWCDTASVCVEKGEKSDVHYIMMNEQREPSGMYVATFNEYMNRIGLSNTNVQFVRTQQLGFYIAASMSKFCRENGEAQSDLERSFMRFDEKILEEEKLRKQRAEAKCAGSKPSADILSEPGQVVDPLPNEQKSTSPKDAGCPRDGSASVSGMSAAPPGEKASSASTSASAPSSASSGDKDDQPPSDFAIGRRRLLSAIFHSSNKQSIAAQMACFINLGTNIFVYSHDFSTLPYKQGLAFLAGETLRCSLSKKNEFDATVFDYAYRGATLADVPWYSFVCRYRLAQKKKDKQRTPATEGMCISCLYMSCIMSNRRDYVPCIRIVDSRVVLASIHDILMLTQLGK
jgi:hypothetical protein